jgi:hypothetical protein
MSIFFPTSIYIPLYYYYIFTTIFLFYFRHYRHKINNILIINKLEKISRRKKIHSRDDNQT